MDRPLLVWSRIDNYDLDVLLNDSNAMLNAIVNWQREIIRKIEVENDKDTNNA